MVILDPEFEAREIREADRAAIATALTRPGSVARNKRGALGVAQFKRIGRQSAGAATKMRKPAA